MEVYECWADAERYCDDLNADEPWDSNYRYHVHGYEVVPSAG